MKTAFGSVDHLGDVLAFERRRHAVLAGNIANVDTPGYQSLDLDATTVGGPARVVADPGPMGADGNAVSLERELAKIDANRVRYAANAELASRRLALLRYAAGDGG
jgi:flagellar basal body rod protein FlgB